MINPNPKHIRIELNDKEYNKLRHRIYLKQYCSCFYCDKWLRFDEFSLHHIISRGAGGDDSEENCMGICQECHDKIHRGIN